MSECDCTSEAIEMLMLQEVIHAHQSTKPDRCIMNHSHLGKYQTEVS